MARLTTRPRLFLSDLHLCDERPQITQLFFDFLHSETAANAGAIYILGDLFELWPGDDLNAYPEVVRRLRHVVNKQIIVYFMPGNRDFLAGQQFYQKTGCTILNDPTIIEVDNQRILLTHGDTLCTDDEEYQSFRREVRSNEWQERALAMPATERLEYFYSLRERSKQATKHKPDSIMDVNQQAVEHAMSNANVRLLIHGHTHRQNIHRLTVNDEPASRIVLGDWDASGNILALSSFEDYQFIELPSNGKP